MFGDYSKIQDIRGIYEQISSPPVPGCQDPPRQLPAGRAREASGAPGSMFSPKLNFLRLQLIEVAPSAGGRGGEVGGNAAAWAVSNLGAPGKVLGFRRLVASRSVTIQQQTKLPEMLRSCRRRFQPTGVPSPSHPEWRLC